MTRIFLLGYMGAGKTTLGRAYAKAMGLDFIDLDWYIEGRYHKSVGQIFAERGEDGFRQLEQMMLHEVGEFDDVVISVGGGTPCFFDNMAYMNTQGQTVYLDVSVDVLFRRLKIAKAKRPLLKDKTDEELRAFINTALENRAPFYEQALYRFDGSRLESRWQIANSVEELRQLLLTPNHHS
jgi:shikimate kinase